MNNAEAYYDKLSAVYDKATEEPGVWTPPFVIAQRLVSICDESSQILDVGIGTGQSVEILVERGNYGKITGIDVSAKMLAHCHEKYPNLHLIHGDIESCDELEDSYDVVVCSGLMEFVPDLEGTVKRIANLLRKDAFLLVTFEPQIEGHAIQGMSKSPTVSSQSSEFHVDDFFTYRYSPQVFRLELERNQLHVVDEIAFVAYRKCDENIIYHLVVARKGVSNCEDLNGVTH